jgi:hypothetical protein
MISTDLPASTSDGDRQLKVPTLASPSSLARSMEVVPATKFPHSFANWHNSTAPSGAAAHRSALRHVMIACTATPTI